MSTKTRGAMTSRSRTWPRRAIGLFVLILVIVYALVFFTGTKKAETKLGIDLQGGTRVTLVPQGGQPTADQLKQAREILEQRVNGQGVTGAEVVTNGNTLVITVPGEDTAQAQAVGQTSKLLFRPVSTTLAPDLPSLGKEVQEMANRWVTEGIITKDQAEATVTNVGNTLKQNNIDLGDVKIDATAKPEPANSIEEAKHRDEATKMLLDDRQSEDPTKLTAASLLLQCQEGSTDPLAGADDPSKPLAACDFTNQTPYILDPVPLLSGVTDPNGTRLTGNEIDTNSPINGGLNSQTGQMEISFAFKTGDGSNGSQTWADLTQANLQKQIAITLDSAVISAPVIQGATPYGSATSITGSFTQDEAQNLANNLKYGALPLSFVGENGEQGGTTETVPPSLGHAALTAGLIAGLVGFLLIAVYSFYYFRGLALVSLLTLLASLVLTYGTLVLLGRWIGYSLDLSGIAGLVIGVGATADSFVVYYERIKDELLDGRTFRSATTKAWERARTTIVTGNAVTLIGSVVVYILAIGEVKGFAFTMGLTTLFDLVVSFLIMAPFMQLIAGRRLWSKAAMNGLGGIYNLVEERRARGFYAKPEKSQVSTGTDAPSQSGDPTASDDADPAFKSEFGEEK